MVGFFTTAEARLPRAGLTAQSRQSPCPRPREGKVRQTPSGYSWSRLVTTTLRNITANILSVYSGEKQCLVRRTEAPPRVQECTSETRTKRIGDIRARRNYPLHEMPCWPVQFRSRRNSEQFVQVASTEAARQVDCQGIEPQPRADNFADFRNDLYGGII
jgi:hypothetical protein